jgi:hypothetical protein
LKAASQYNSYPHAVNSTYLMATGAQRQHFSVLSAMGITMGYTSVISQGKETTTATAKVCGIRLTLNTAIDIVQRSLISMVYQMRRTLMRKMQLRNLMGSRKRGKLKTMVMIE